MISRNPTFFQCAKYESLYIQRGDPSNIRYKFDSWFAIAYHIDNIVRSLKKLASYGLGMGNVLNIGKQALYAQIINPLIAMLHLLFCGKSGENEKMFEVRTRRIISCSNVLATCSNLIVSGIGVASK